MLIIKTRLAEGGWVVIPPEFCQSLGLQAGDEVILLLEDGAMRLLTRSQVVKRAQELVKPYLPHERSQADELIAEHRLEAENE